MSLVGDQAGASGNGAVDPVRIEWPPIVPPEGGRPQPPPEPEREERADHRTGYFADLFAWWRTRRERHLIERIRGLSSENALLKEENMQLGFLLEKLNRWVQASTVAAARIADQLGAAPDPRREKRV